MIDSTDPLDQFSSVRLTREEEKALADRIAKGEEDALNELVMANMREALRYTQRVSYELIDARTRISLCYQEMCMSARRFIPGKLRFFAFAKPGLRGRMKNYWTSLNVVRNAKQILNIDWVGYPKPGDQIKQKIAQTSASVSSRLCGWRVLATQTPSLAFVEQPRLYRESITGEAEDDKLELIMAKDHVHEIETRLKHLLTEREWMILNLTYRGGLNFPQIGKLLGLTRSAIHAAHRDAIKKLRVGIAKDPRLLE